MTNPRRKTARVAVPVPYVEMVTFSPEEAEERLLNNEGNRKLKIEQIRKHVSMMQRGLWTVSWDLIAFAPNGRILNGQNRLTACSMSGVPLTTFVIFNCPEISQDTGDRALQRSLAQSLMMRQEKDANNLQAAIFYCMHYEDKTLPSNTSYETLDALDWFNENSDLREFTVAAGAWKRTGSPAISRSRLLALSYLFSKYSDSEMVDDFFTMLATGALPSGVDDGPEVAITTSSPIFHLRRGLNNVERLNQFKREQNTLSAWTIKCWNNYILGNQGPKFYALKPNEAYPTITPSAADLADLDD